jgi:hypothetical protein
MASRSIMNVLGCGLAILLISGCAAPMPQRIEVSAKPVQKPELVLPNADQLRMREVEWTIITPENFEAKIEEIKKSGRPVVFFALTDKGYENLGLNFSDIRAFIQQQKAIIAAYENYYKNANEALDKANANIDGAKQEVEGQQKMQEKSESSWKFWK